MSITCALDNRIEVHKLSVGENVTPRKVLLAELEKIQRTVDLYFMPWGAAKAAMWGELTDDGVFSSERGMQLIYNILHSIP